MFSSCFMLFPTFKKKNLSKKISGGGGGILKNIFLISRFILFSTLKNNNIEKFPFTYWLNGAISNILKKKVCQKISGGGGGVLNLFVVRKQFFIISRFMLFSTLKKIILKSFPSLTG